jgi:hypothetical protein
MISLEPLALFRAKFLPFMSGFWSLVSMHNYANSPNQKIKKISEKKSEPHANFPCISHVIKIFQAPPSLSSFQKIFNLMLKTE